MGPNLVLMKKHTERMDEAPCICVASGPEMLSLASHISTKSPAVLLVVVEDSGGDNALEEVII